MKKITPEKIILSLSSNPGLALTGFRTINRLFLLLANNRLMDVTQLALNWVEVAKW